MSSIWKRTTLLINNMDSITGRFNSSLERNFIICLDEALFVGDGKSRDRLKSMITEPTITIEEKFQPTKTIDSYHRFFAATNAEHFTHIERDDRRFLFLRSGDSRKQDTSYFEELVKSFEDGETLSGFVDYLLNYPTELDIRTKPRTQEHVDQKIKSLERFERYWSEVLFTGDFSGSNREGSFYSWREPVFKTTTCLIDSYKEFDRNAEKHAAIQMRTIKEQIARICQSATSARRKSDQVQSRGFDFPSLKVAREDFEGYLGCKVPWDE
jgi:hypothetical protein